MVFKRPFCDEESSQISFKLQRQLEYNNQLASSVNINSSDDVSHKPNGSADEAGGGSSKSQFEDCLRNGDITEQTTGADKEFETSAHGSISSLSWATNSSTEDDSKSDTAVHLSFFPRFFESDQPTRTFIENKEIYSPVMDFPPRRLVPVGPDHQADVPIWDVQGISESSKCQDVSDLNSSSPRSLGSNQMVEDCVKEKMMGTCIIPMPDSEAFDYTEIGRGRTDCNCQDGGSVRCSRQHILEASEKLRVNLGRERFVELGFCDMGEEVAKKWSEEEEQVFHEVVFSYPASMGKNFWSHLPVVFPSRTQKELVSYYFNVFMLRRRGVQNRMDPNNIDSDNDEWQGSDDGDDEFGTEDEDSVVESPFGQDNLVYSEDQRENFHEDDEGEDDESCEEDSNIRDDGVARGEDEKPHTGKLGSDCSYDPAHAHICEDIQDDSCTSYECQPSRTNSHDRSVVPAKQECHVESDSHSKHFQSSYDGSNMMGNFGYDMEFCDSKIWDLGYLRGPETDVDLLPTCNMMKEVFGEEGWNNKGRGESKTIG